MEVVVTTGAIRRAKLQSKCHHQQTNIQFLYRPDALPVAQPTASNHRREMRKPVAEYLNIRDFAPARDDWHKRSNQIIVTNIRPITSILQVGCPSCHSTNTVKALKATRHEWLNMPAVSSVFGRFAVTSSWITLSLACTPASAAQPPASIITSSSLASSTRRFCRDDCTASLGLFTADDNSEYACYTVKIKVLLSSTIHSISILTAIISRWTWVSRFYWWWRCCWQLEL